VSDASPTLTAIDEPQPSAAAPPSILRLAGCWIEARLVGIIERANPILVKETRQALKSRQFIVTFFVVLAACLIVSFAGVALIGPRIYYAAAGPPMLVAYYMILTGPLAMIVPFSAYRSLASEQEDNTYDLLSISTLTSQQIITGKLASAAVQMLVYLCAVSPCIAFTFLLRGVDAMSTAFLIVGAILGCMGLSMLSLLVGAMARVRSTQIVISVGLVLGLAGALSFAYAVAFEIAYHGVPQDVWFWVGVLGMLTFYVTTFGLVHSAAAAQLAFPSENRSTPLRRWMMAQQAALCGWLAGLAYVAAYDDPGEIREMLIGCLCVASLYWYFMGALLTSEWPHLSRRVQRSLPQSALGRTFLSLFNPGPGAGYLFAVANLTALSLAGAVVALLLADSPGRRWNSTETTLYFLLLSWAYVVALLGLGRLTITLLRRWVYVPMTAGFLTHLVIVLTGIGLPTLIQLTSRQLRYGGYSLLLMSNPIWTISSLLDDGPDEVQAPILALVIPAFAMAMLLLNMRSVATELMHHRVAPPIRVAEDEAELHPAPTPGPANPWEADERVVSNQRSAVSGQPE
jgi:hypothetical protein